MADAYTLTVKFAPPGTGYKDGTSTWGHVWLEARKPGESLNSKPSFSAGWSTGSTMYRGGEDNISPYDWKDYQGKDISSITVEISEAQFNKLQNYLALARTGKILGFRSVYDAGDNSCIDFAGKGVGYIGLADKNFDGSGLFWARPDKQVNAFLEQIAKHRPQGADLTVEHRGRTYVFGEQERGAQQFWKTVDPYWYLSQNVENKQNQSEYAQIAPAFRLENMPQSVQKIYHAAEAHLTEYHQKNGLTIDGDKLQNSAMALASLGYSKRMNDAPLFNVKEGAYLIGELNPFLIRASIDMKQAALTPLEESVSRVQQEEMRFEQEQEMKLAQSQSRGMMIS